MKRMSKPITHETVFFTAFRALMLGTLIAAWCVLDYYALGYTIYLLILPSSLSGLIGLLNMFCFLFSLSSSVLIVITFIASLTCIWDMVETLSKGEPEDIW